MYLNIHYTHTIQGKFRKLSQQNLILVLHAKGFLKSQTLEWLVKVQNLLRVCVMITY